MLMDPQSVLRLSNRLGAQKSNTTDDTAFARGNLRWDTLIYSPELEKEELITGNSRITRHVGFC